MFLNLNKIGEFSDTSFYDCQIAIQNCVQFCSYFTITNLQPLSIYMVSKWKEMAIVFNSALFHILSPSELQVSLQSPIGSSVH